MTSQFKLSFVSDYYGGLPCFPVFPLLHDDLIHDLSVSPFTHKAASLLVDVLRHIHL